MTIITKLRERLEAIHHLLISPPEESNLNHYEKTRLEEEFEEVELKLKERGEEVVCS